MGSQCDRRSAFGALSFNGTDDFRSRGRKLDYDPSRIDLKCVRFAFDISERLRFQMMAYDFLFRQGEPVVLEMNFSNGTPRGYWKRNVEWVSEPMSPQEAQVETVLKQIRTVQQEGGRNARAFTNS